jgi:hypothetical protein
MQAAACLSTASFSLGREAGLLVRVGSAATESGDGGEDLVGGLRAGEGPGDGARGGDTDDRLLDS